MGIIRKKFGGGILDGIYECSLFALSRIFFYIHFVPFSHSLPGGIAPGICGRIIEHSGTLKGIEFICHRWWEYFPSGTGIALKLPHRIYNFHNGIVVGICDHIPCHCCRGCRILGQMFRIRLEGAVRCCHKGKAEVESKWLGTSCKPPRDRAYRKCVSRSLRSFGRSFRKGGQLENVSFWPYSRLHCRCGSYSFSFSCKLFHRCSGIPLKMLSSTQFSFGQSYNHKIEWFLPCTKGTFLRDKSGGIRVHSPSFSCKASHSWEWGLCSFLELAHWSSWVDSGHMDKFSGSKDSFHNPCTRPNGN